MDPAITAITAVVIVWILILLKLAKDLVAMPKKRVVSVIGKGLSSTQSKSITHKYVVIPIFSHPSATYRLNTTEIKIDLVSHNIKTAALTIDPKHLYITRNICCVRDIRAFFVLHRKRTLNAISRVRVYHTCPEDGQYNTNI